MQVGKVAKNLLDTHILQFTTTLLLFITVQGILIPDKPWYSF